MNDWIVVGGGYRGIAASHLLAKEGHKVTLVEKEPFLGGVMYSHEWEDFYIDLGCHLFDNSEDRITEINFEIMGDDVIPVHVNYAAITDGHRSDGIIIPDFTLLEPARRKRLLEEMLAAADAGADPATAADMDEMLRRRFGKLAAELLAPKIYKYFGLSPETLDPLARHMAPFTKLYVTDDSTAMELKKNPAYDEILAASSQDDPMKFYRDKAKGYPHRNFYPKNKGMRGFCEKALAHLPTLGVEVLLGRGVADITKQAAELAVHLEDGETLHGHKVLWTLGGGSLGQLLFGEDPLDDLIHPVPLAIYYFALPREKVSDDTYIHDYSHDGLVVRHSAPGVYSGQVRDDGMTYVCMEAFTRKDAPLWQDPEAFLDPVWGEAVHAGLVYGDRPECHHILQAPVSFKVPKKGFSAVLEGVLNRITGFSDHIVLVEQTAFTKEAIFTKVLNAAAA
jgi:hypothetical protein